MTIDFNVKSRGADNVFDHLAIKIDKIIAVYDQYDSETGNCTVTIDLISGISYQVLTENDCLGGDIVAILSGHPIEKTILNDVPNVLEVKVIR